MPDLTEREETPRSGKPLPRWLGYTDLVVSSLLSAIVLADFLQTVLQVALSLGLLAPLVALPWAVGIAIVRLLAAAWGRHAAKPVSSGQRPSAVYLVSRLTWADTVFVLGLGTLLEENRTHEPVVIGALMLVSSVLLVVLPLAGRVWSVVPVVLLGALCVLRLQEIGDRPSMTREQVWLFASVIALTLHVAATVLPGVPCPSGRTTPQSSALKWPRWMVCVPLLGLAAWSIQPSGVAIGWLCLGWLLLRGGVELLAALPTRLSLLQNDLSPPNGSSVPIELTMVALVLVFASLPREMDGPWTRVIGFSAMVWAARVSAQRSLHPTGLVQVGGLAASLFTLPLAAYIEKSTLPFAINSAALAFGGLWLAIAWTSVRRRTV